MDDRTREDEEVGFDQLKRLYPFVDEKRTPLPRCWSTKDKYQFLGLSQNNLRVHYKGTLGSSFSMILLRLLIKL